jgi:hypothetical protein
MVAHLVMVAMRGMVVQDLRLEVLVVPEVWELLVRAATHQELLSEDSLDLVQE